MNKTDGGLSPAKLAKDLARRRVGNAQTSLGEALRVGCKRCTIAEYRGIGVSFFLVSTGAGARVSVVQFIALIVQFNFNLYTQILPPPALALTPQSGSTRDSQSPLSHPQFASFIGGGLSQSACTGRKRLQTRPTSDLQTLPILPSTSPHSTTLPGTMFLQRTASALARRTPARAIAVARPFSSSIVRST